MKYFGTRKGSEVASFSVFSHIWMMCYFRLGCSRVKECPGGLELTKEPIETRKTILKIRRNPQLLIYPFIQKYFMKAYFYLSF